MHFLRPIPRGFPRISRSVAKMGGAQFKISVREMVDKWRKTFTDQGISEPKESIEHITAFVLGTKNVNDVHSSSTKYLSLNQQNQIERFCKQRLNNMPVQYIIREWDFRDLTLKMRPPVFIPRPETEQLVDLILSELPKDSEKTILELCCGSGAISLAVLKERPFLKAIAVDKLKDACELTKENAELCEVASRISVIENDLTNFNFELIRRKHFDLIVSNPPYILSKDMDTLQPEIFLYEDVQALDGGFDGLKIITALLTVASQLLNVGGKLFLEVDPTHPAALKEYLQIKSELQLSLARTYPDFCHKNRFVQILKT